VGRCPTPEKPESAEVRCARKPNPHGVTDVPSDLFIRRGVPDHIRSDKGSEFIAKAAPTWMAGAGAGTADIAPGSP
jgi:hypothetical protein